MSKLDAAHNLLFCIGLRPAKHRSTFFGSLSRLFFYLVGWREQLIDGKAVIYPNVKKAVIHYYLYGCKLVPLERLQEWNSNSAHYRWLYYGYISLS
ncbi:Diacylglycerol pyrophosphate phosphatase [Dirofilaria immitis]